LADVPGRANRSRERFEFEVLENMFLASFNGSAGILLAVARAHPEPADGPSRPRSGGEERAPGTTFQLPPQFVVPHPALHPEPWGDAAMGSMRRWRLRPEHP
jgi:hypothetical protein